MTLIERDDDYEEGTQVTQIEHWIRVVVFLALFLTVLAFIAPGCAYAHDWAHPELDNWYSHLQATGKGTLSSGASCCSKQDCHTTEAEIRDGEWWARYGTPKDNGVDWDLGPWVHIPNEIIVRGPNGNAVANQAGEAVICHPIIRGTTVHADNAIVYCFVPPDQS